jgi:uncharacterized integral membrane protein
MGNAMKTGLYVALLIVVLLVVGVIAQFAVENSSRTTDLTLDLYFVAWKLKEPASIPVLIASAFGGGFGLGLLLLLARVFKLGRRVRVLEREVALSGRSDAADGARTGWR